jgi:hypothetical protein
MRNGVAVITALSFAAALSAPVWAKQSQKSWQYQGDTHIVTIRDAEPPNDAGRLVLTAEERVGEHTVWSLKDYIDDCPVDANLTLINGSFEIIDPLGDGNKATLFAYILGCRGGVDPREIKYFAFYNGKKHALRGEETIVLSNDRYGGETPPKADYQLKSNPFLLSYMQKKWPKLAHIDYTSPNHQ